MVTATSAVRQVKSFPLRLSLPSLPSFNPIIIPSSWKPARVAMNLRSLPDLPPIPQNFESVVFKYAKTHKVTPDSARDRRKAIMRALKLKAKGMRYDASIPNEGDTSLTLEDSPDEAASLEDENFGPPRMHFKSVEYIGDKVLGQNMIFHLARTSYVGSLQKRADKMCENATLAFLARAYGLHERMLPESPASAVWIEAMKENQKANAAIFESYIGGLWLACRTDTPQPDLERLAALTQFFGRLVNNDVFPWISAEV